MSANVSPDVEIICGTEISNIYSKSITKTSKLRSKILPKCWYDFK